MSNRLYFLVLSIIFATSTVSIFLLINYMNPIPNPKLSISLLALAIFLSASSFLTPILYFLKKIYYRGDVNIVHINSSLRQSILIVLMILFTSLLHILNIEDNTILITAIISILCIEIMFQAID